MGLDHPYARCYRPNLQDIGRYNLYMHDSRYVEHPGQVLKGVEILYKDLETLFDYIEPADKNEACFSFRTYELLLRCCTEVEANLKAIMKANICSVEHYNMGVYWKINITHHLSSYKIHIPNWWGDNSIRTPFGAWDLTMNASRTIPWYDAYNTVKHNRIDGFAKANLKCVIDAFCGLLIILAAQFYDEDFVAKNIEGGYGYSVISDGLSSTIGAPFRIEFPNDWSDDECYSFNWDDIKAEPEPYHKLTY